MCSTTTEDAKLRELMLAVSLTIRTIDDVLRHPGLESSIGALEEVRGDLYAAYSEIRLTGGTPQRKGQP